MDKILERALVGNNINNKRDCQQPDLFVVTLARSPGDAWALSKGGRGQAGRAPWKRAEIADHHLLDAQPSAEQIKSYEEKNNLHFTTKIHKTAFEILSRAETMSPTQQDSKQASPRGHRTKEALATLIAPPPANAVRSELALS